MEINLPNLYEAILALKTSQDCELFFKDLCTPKEIKDLHDRWYTAQHLYAGNLSYRDIHHQTGVSLSTITRVARFLSHEPYQGYRMMIERLRSQK